MPILRGTFSLKNADDRCQFLIMCGIMGVICRNTRFMSTILVTIAKLLGGKLGMNKINIQLEMKV